MRVKGEKVSSRYAALSGRVSLCVAGVVLISQGFSIAAENLFSFETTDGLSVTWGQNIKGHFELSQAAGFVTEGTHALRLRAEVPPGMQGNQYVGVRINFARPVDLRRRIIWLDAATSTPEQTRALYLRGYDEQGRRALSFVNWSSPLNEKPRSLRCAPKMSSFDLSWEANEVAADADLAHVVAIELIIGTPNTGVVMDAYFDNLRAEETQMQSWEEVAGPKTLVRETALVRGGRPAAVVIVPVGEEWSKPAQELVQSIARYTGVQLSVRRIATVSDLLAEGKLPAAGSIDESKLDASTWGGAPIVQDGEAFVPLIIGNVCDTAALLYLYSHGYCAADHFYPGSGGYEIRTIHDPWGKGVNALVIGCSDPAGAREAVGALGPVLAANARPGELILPPTLLIRLTGEAERRYGKLVQNPPRNDFLEREKEAAERELRTGAHTGLWGHIANVGESYMRSGYGEYARAFVWLVRRAKEHYDTRPTTYGGPWGMDSDFAVYRVLPAWDVVEEDAGLSDEERWEITRILHQWVSEVAVRPAEGTVRSKAPRHNHQTFPALGLMYAADYFGKYYHTWESEEWLSIADACFRQQSTMFKPHEDCNGYQWLTLSHLAQYCLARPDFAYFLPSALWGDEGKTYGGQGSRWGQVCNARRDADYAILGTDSFGYATTYGDTGNFVGWWSELVFLRLVNCVLRDPEYQWVIERKTQRSGRVSWGQYAISLTAKEPTRLAGTLAFPLDRDWWEAHRGDDTTPLATAVDKVCMRDGFEDESEYALLDGLNPGGHRHYDGNSVSRWCARGRIWVADADYFRAEPQAHSTVIVIRNGLASPMPNLCEGGHVADLPSFGASETIMRAYNGVDWHRWLLWAKGGGLLVADRFAARESGDYSFRVYWQLLGDISVGEHWVDLHQNGEWARVAFPSDASLVVTEDQAYGENWSGYPHLQRYAVQVVRAVYDVRLEAGETFVAWTLLQATGTAPGQARLRRGGAMGVVVENGSGEGVMAAGLSSAPPIGPSRQAAAWVLSLSRLATVGQDGRDAETNLAEGEVTVLEPAGAGPDPIQQVRKMQDEKLRARAEEVRDACAKLPRLSAAPGAAERPRRALERRWGLWPKPNAFVLTGNQDFAVPTVNFLGEVAVQPAPREMNLFSSEAGRNRVANLFDGRLTGTGDCVMWDADQTVTLVLSMTEEVEPRQLDLRAWWVSSSSKGAKFQVASIEVELSGDGFRKDVRLGGKLTDESEHENWGGSPQAPERYLVELSGEKCRQIRIRMVPRPGTGVYLAELYLLGTAQVLADEGSLAKHVAGMPYFTCLAAMPQAGTVAGGRSDGELWLVNADGEPLWREQLARPVLSLAAVRFDGERPALVAGCRQGKAAAFDTDGKKLWEIELEQYKRAPHINVVIGADFSGRGHETAVLGAENWRYYAVDGTGKVLWHYESVHLATAACAADLTGDGLHEVVLGTNYYWWHAVKGDGTRLWQYSTRTGPECTAVAAGDLDGDGKAEVVFATGDGTLQCVGADGGLRWMIYLGDRATALACSDVDGDGKAELLAASANCIAYCIEDAGVVRWYANIRQPIRAACLAAGHWICGCEDGSIWAVRTTDGKVLAQAQMAGQVVAITGRETGFFVATKTGQLAAFALPEP